MIHRLLLGSGSLVTTVANALAEQSGTLRVATTDERVADTLGEQSVPAEHFETIDEEVLRSMEPPALVGVLDDSRERSRRLAAVARNAFPDAEIVGYDGWEGGELPGTGPAQALEATADIVVDARRELGQYVLDRVGDNGTRMRELQRVLRDIDHLAVVSHDNPDPDAIASGVALARLAQRAGCEAEVCYYGEITHQENLAFVNMLDLDLRGLEPDEELAEFDGIALVDHSRPGVNDQLPPGIGVDIVIDHHPPRSPVNAGFVDLRSNVGATSTLLVDYIDQFDIPFDETLATALLFGIHVDTDGFSREISEQDFIAGAKLVEHADFGMLEQIGSPSISVGTFEIIARAIRNRRVEGPAVLSCVGRLSERDALAQAADRLLTLEDVSIVVVYGIKDGEIYVSGRARGAEIDLGEALREAFGQIGSAGGHVDMAGAQIELGVLESVEDREESLTEIVEDVVSSRFLDVLRTGPNPPLDNRYETEAEIDAEYLGEEVSEEGTVRSEGDGSEEAGDTAGSP